RRGAQMATFDVGHPDVMDFVRAKREDGRLRQFNLSLLITEDFMEAVKHDGKWDLAFPVTEKEVEEDRVDMTDSEIIVWRDWPYKDGFITNETGKIACKIYKTIRAQRLWDVIMSSTYDYAEPGFILIDKVNQMNNNWFCENVRATNPCVTADTWVQTSTGPRQVEELIGTPFTARIDGSEYLSGAEGFFKTADKEVVRLQTTEGHNLRLTADHKVRRVTTFTRYRTETEWCEAGKLRAGDRVLLNDHRSNCTWEGEHNHGEGYLLGLLIGDGTLKSDKAVLSVWKPAAVANGCNSSLSGGTQAVMDEALAAAHTLPHRSDFNGWMEVPGRNEFRLSTAALKELAEKMGMSPGHKGITDSVEQASSDFYRGVLRGLFDADGSVQGNQKKGVSIRLAQSNLPLLEAAQRMLLRLGIASTLYRERRPQGTKYLPNGKGGEQEYTIKAQHELVISGENLRQYHNLIGFGDSDKQDRLENLINNYQRSLNRERFTARVKSVEPAGFEAVYDVQVPGINTFDANGLHAHNCGEQPLPPYGACLLGSINLTKFICNAFTKEASFDWDQFRKVVATFTRMLDNVVDINGLPLPEQREEIERKRRHGMGYLGLGSSMTMLGMKYGDPRSLEFTEQITKE
ncbi:MAG: LAGLIDADG family homing endonuclease, partial [Candidatus Sedimenticola sp. (ex Thyasira tokunagai)]